MTVKCIVIFEIKGSKQLKNVFYYAWKMGKMPKFISLDNLEKLGKYWESEEFQKLSSTGKKNRTNDVDGVGLSLHTCGAIPLTKWHRRFVRITCLVIFFKIIINMITNELFAFPVVGFS